MRSKDEYSCTLIYITERGPSLECGVGDSLEYNDNIIEKNKSSGIVELMVNSYKRIFTLKKAEKALTKRYGCFRIYILGMIILHILCSVPMI